MSRETVRTESRHRSSRNEDYPRGGTRNYRTRIERYKQLPSWQVLVRSSAWGMEEVGNPITGMEPGKPVSVFARAIFEALGGNSKEAITGIDPENSYLPAQKFYLYIWDYLEQKAAESANLPRRDAPGFFSMENHRGGDFLFFDHLRSTVTGKITNPYMGLCAFEVEDSRWFFGRETELIELMAKLSTTDLLVISGPPASGKSSLVKAGLLRALQEKNGTTLLELYPGGELRDQIHDMTSQIDPNKPQMLFLDPFDAFFTRAENDPGRSIFQDWLMESLEGAAAQQNKIILCIRDTYLRQLQESPFGQMLWGRNAEADFLYQLQPPSAEGVQEALEKPAILELHDFENPALKDQILADIQASADIFPALSLGMRELFEITGKVERRFRAKDYETEIMPVSEFFGKQSQRMYDELSLDILRRGVENILLRLIGITKNDQLYSRRLFLNHPEDDRLKELEYEWDQDERIIGQLLTKLEETALIVVEKDSQERSYVELNTDQVIDLWPLFRQWIDALGPEQIRLRMHLWEATVDYHLAFWKDQEPPLLSLWDNDDRLRMVTDQLVAMASESLRDKNSLLVRKVRQIKQELNLQHQSIFQTLLNNWEQGEELPKLQDFDQMEASGRLLDVLLEEGEHHLNRREVYFIRNSWEKRSQRTISLTRESVDVKRIRDLLEIMKDVV